MKLLLDEMYSPSVAIHLRDRGHDAVAVLERAELAGLSDAEIFALAQAEGRALVTENRDDFLELARIYRGQRRDHRGIIIVGSGRFSRRASAIGELIDALDRFIQQGEIVALESSFVRWLR